RHRRRVGRLLQERLYDVILVHIDDSERTGFRPRHFETAHSNVRASLDMLSQHDLVIHLVDMIAGEQHDEPAAVALDDIDVLIDGIRSSHIPHRFGNALAGRQDVKTFVTFRTEEIPAHLQVTDKAVGLVLCGNRNATDAGIECIRESEIYDAGLAAKIDGGLGPPVSKLQKPATSTARQNEGQGVTCQRLIVAVSHLFLPLQPTATRYSDPRSTPSWSKEQRSFATRCFCELLLDGLSRPGSAYPFWPPSSPRSQAPRCWPSSFWVCWSRPKRIITSRRPKWQRPLQGLGSCRANRGPHRAGRPRMAARFSRDTQTARSGR